MERLAKEQSRAGKAIEKMVENFYKDPKSRKTQRYHQSRLEKLQQAWNAFNTRHQEMKQFEATNPAHPYFEEDFFTQVETVYDDFKGELEDALKKFAPTTTSAPNPEDHQLQRKIRVQHAAISSLAQLLTKTKESFTSQQSSVFYQQQLETLNGYWNEVRATHQELVGEEDTSLYDQGSYQGVETDFYQVTAKLTELIGTVHNPRQETLSTTQAQNTAVRLPKITIPTFNGDYSKWKQFYDLFTNVIHSQSLPNSQKMFYLKSSLSGEAGRLIQHLEVSETNYTTAWNILRDRYENKRLIVSAFLNSILSIPNMNSESALQLKRLHDTVKEATLGIQNVGVPTTNWDALLLHIMLQKVDRETHRLFEQSLNSPREIPSLSSFLGFIQSRFQLLETLGDRKEKTLQRDHKKQSSLLTTRPAHSCSLCKGTHKGLFKCSAFIKLSIPERIKAARKHYYCLNCLRVGHATNACSSRGCLKCNQHHNTLLHQDSRGLQGIQHASTENMKDTKFKANPQPESNSTAPLQYTADQSRAVHTAFKWDAKVSNYIFLGTALLNITDKFEQTVKCRAILDSGSQLNFISERLVKRLGFKISQQQANISGIGHFEVKSKGRLNVKIHSRVTGFETRLEVLILPEITSEQPSQPFNIDSWPIPKNIQLADPEFNKPSKIDILLGAEVYCELMSIGQIKLSEHLPTLQNSVFGWVVLGKVNRSINSCLPFCGITTSLDTQLKQFWAMEEYDCNTEPLTEKEKRCEDHFNKHTYRNSEGRFVVKLPFDQSPALLGDSKEIAIRRFLSIEKRLQKDHALKEQYKAFMKELLDLNHMELINKLPDQHYILPHHCVLRPESSTTKLRVVNDGSCKTSSNLSLNDILLVGPKTQDNLFSILLRFRLYKYVFTADITKMYRQILVHEDDRKYQIIIWRNEPTEKLQFYQLRTVVYGTASAPYLATRCLKKLAEEGSHKYPLGSRILIQDFYVDDVMTGSNSLTEAMKMQSELRTLLTEAGLPLRKWSANNSNLLKAIPKEDIEATTNIGQDDEEQVKTLGLIWYPKSDKFSIKINLPDIKRVTKRSILADIAHIYDPLGLINPIVTLGKIFLQQLWQLQLEWDEAIPQELHSRWLQFREGLQSLKSIAVPRHVFNRHKASIIQLHGFSDASEKAYGAAIYIRSTDQNNHTTTKLLCAKSKVAPLKKSTLPRLELAAAQLMVKLVKQLKDVLHLPIENTYYWTDSTITLSWINSSSSSLKTFVANRVAYIQENSQLTQWRHIGSKLNPADLVSRGSTAKQLLSDTIWFTGPQFLQEDPVHWPQVLPPSVRIPEEIRKPKFVMSATRQGPSILDQINHKGSFKTLLHIVGFVQRFTDNLRRGKNIRIKDNCLQPHELDNSLNFIISELQRKYFSDEIQRLSKHQTVLSSSKLKSLVPFLDNEGLIRVGGRLQNANLPYDTKHQILLPHNDELVKLLAVHHHVRHLHAGPQALLAIIRQQFWPLNGKRLVQSVVRSCVRCARLRPVFLKQLMGNLPTERVQPARAFINVGVDFCGPIQIHYKIRGKRPTKAYIAVFVCFCTRAVHLELVSDLTKDAFIGALKRFIGRRGKPSKIFCDNATNFTGARNELSDVHALFTNPEFQAKIKQHCSDDYIKWCFIPPRTPHFGGLWEAAVKSAKHHLKRVLLSTSLTYEELNTVIVEIEAVLNSRPLTPLSSDPNDLHALSPGHFLIGEPLTALPNPHVQPKEEKLLQRWERVKSIQRHFWARWSKEYLQQLQQRTKWQQPSNTIKTGTLVLIKDDLTSPLKWPLGRVIEEIKGQDGLTRVVNIKTEKGIISRAIHNLCPLPINSNIDVQPANQLSVPSTIHHQEMPSTSKQSTHSLLITTSTNQQAQKQVSSRRSRKGRFLPINSAWLQTPFKPSQELQKYYNVNRSDTEEPNTKRPRKETTQQVTGSKLFCVLLAILTILPIPGQAAKTNDFIDIIPWENRPIIYFEDVAHMSMATDTWNIMVYYNMNGYWKEINSLKTQLGRLKDICHQSSLTHHTDYCKLILFQFQRQMDIIEANNEILLTRNGDPSRTRRSPLDIVGTVANKLFGILDQDYADHMTDTINKVRRNEEHLLKLIKNQTSIIDSTENILRRDREFTDKQFIVVNNYLNRLHQAMADINTVISQQEAFETFNALSIHSSLIIMSYQQLQTALLDIVTDCHNGKINPLLLTPDQLRKELSRIRENIPTSLSVPVSSNHAELLQLYNLMTVQTRVTQEYILFNVHLPLTSKELYQVFKPIPIPIAVNNTSKQVRIASQFIAVNLHRDHYYLLTEDELSRCATNERGTLICNKKHTVFQKNTGIANCELQLLNNEKKLPSVCILETVKTQNTWYQLHNQNNWIYALRNECIVNVVCGTQIFQQVLSETGILKFKANCVLRQDSITISSHHTYTSRIDHSFIPSITLNDTELKAHLIRQEFNLSSHELLTRNNTGEIDRLKGTIQELQSNLKLPENLAPVIHHYTVSYLALALIIITVTVYIIKTKLCQGNLKESHFPPEPAPRRSNFQLRSQQTDSTLSRVETQAFNGREDVHSP